MSDQLSLHTSQSVALLERGISSTPLLKQVVVMIAPPECISILTTVMAPLPMDLPSAVVILVHGHSQMDRPLSPNLNKARFPVEPGVPGTRIRPGHAIIAQFDDAVEVGLLDVLEKSPAPISAGTSPLLISLISRFGPQLMGVVLTSLHGTEARAMKTIRTLGGEVIALDDTDRGWLHENAPKVSPDLEDVCLPAEKIGAEILRFVTGRTA